MDEAMVRRNRRNARKSTGPRTPEGKRVAALNAVKHGLTASLRPLPGLEDGQAWNHHLQQTNASLQPVGYLEQTLAERVAVQLWRLGRVVRFESESAALALDRVEQDVTDQERDPLTRMQAKDRGKPVPLGETVDQLREMVADGKETLEFLDSLDGMKAGQSIDRDQAQRALSMMAARANVDLEAEDAPAARGIHPSPGWLAVNDWTAGKLQAAAAVMAQRCNMDGPNLLKWVRSIASDTVRGLEDDLTRRQQAEDAERVRRMLPDGDTLQNVARYEAHLERSLMSTLHELQRLQALRNGGQVMAPVAVDLCSSAGG